MMQNDSQARELIEMGERIRERQESIQGAELNNTAWLKAYPALGSTKTYLAIVTGNLGGYDVERWLLEYQSVWNLIEADKVAAHDRDPVYEDLSPVTRLRVAVVDVMAAKGNDRLVIVQGPSGAGKTESARLIAQRFGKRVLLVEADETWKDSINAMLTALLTRLDEAVPLSAAARMSKLIDVLGSRRIMLVIDEAHHMGPRQLNLIKTLINQTPGEVVLLALDTLWDKLEGLAYAEARQLIHNRLSERIVLSAPMVDDIEKLLSRRLGLQGEEARRAAEMVRRVAMVKGSLKYATRVCRRALALSGGAETSLEDVAKAVGMVSQTMGVRS